MCCKTDKNETTRKAWREPALLSYVAVICLLCFCLVPFVPADCVLYVPHLFDAVSAWFWFQDNLTTFGRWFWGKLILQSGQCGIVLFCCYVWWHSGDKINFIKSNVWTFGTTHELNRMKRRIKLFSVINWSQLSCVKLVLIAELVCEHFNYLQN